MEPLSLVLFDIDGTLVKTGGAGTRAFTRSLEETFGVRDGLRDVRMGGKTDVLILEEALSKAGLPAGLAGDRLEQFYEGYLEFLDEELAAGADGFVVLDGVGELLDLLQQDQNILLGLATGNIEMGAWAKLRYAALDRYFRFGGFGSDARDRTEVVLCGIRRARPFAAERSLSEVFVIGDTPMDIIHGRRAGARVVAVASGSYSREELSAFGADLVVGGLAPAAPVYRFLRSHV